MAKNKLTQRARLSIACTLRLPSGARLIALFLVVTTAISLIAQKGLSIPEEIEWTWEVRPPHPDPQLPNVLLLGDSISRAYFPKVTKDLAGVANLYLMASTTSVGDPRLLRQIAEFSAMEGVRFSVVHFNNGMHGWAGLPIQSASPAKAMHRKQSPFETGTRA